MSEWDKLWENQPLGTNALKFDGGLSRYGKWIKQVKAEGDRMQEKIEEEL